jgi:hypothetical protein
LKERENAKALQDQNAALEKSDFTFDANGKVIMVKKNSRYGNLNSGSQFNIKDPEPEGGASRQGKKKKANDARRSNLESIQEDDDNMLKMLKNDENESNHNDLDLPVITD